MHGVEPAGPDALTAGWDWLSTLPRTPVAHAERGDDPLAAVTALLAALDDPHQRLAVIHIAGSKGKGSTALFIEALLREMGQRTFTYTSPHLQRWTERLRIDGRDADPSDALAALEAVRRASDRTGVRPGFFEALTVAGLWLAERSGVDWVILEAGVGGRADATNVVRPRATIITGIELEHTDRLGTTLEAIAREKLGIVKPRVPLIAPCPEPALEDLYEQTTTERSSEWLRLHRQVGHVRAEQAPHAVAWCYEQGRLTAAGAAWSVRTKLNVGGAHMAGNAALAIATVARLGIVSASVLQRSARVLAGLTLPGRLETVSRLPWVIVDGAHTAASASALAQAVRELAPARLHLLLSLTTGKDVDSVVEPLLATADCVTATCADSQYSLDAHALARHIRTLAPSCAVSAVERPEDAIARAANDRPGDTLVLATGSVYLAGAVRAAMSIP